MNKKIFVICLILALLAVVLCFASCDNAADRLREINSALLKDYSQISLLVVTSSDEAKLHATYVMTEKDGEKTVSYQVERLNGFENGSVPDDFISVVRGTAVCSGNSVTVIDGEALDDAILLNVVNTNMVFRLSYFGEIKVSNHGINARVTNPQGLLQNDDFAGTNMTVRVSLNGDYLSHMYIDYVLNDSNVSLEYSFIR